MKIYIFILTCVIGLIVSSCAKEHKCIFIYKDSKSKKDVLINFNLKNVNKDVLKNVNNKDYRFFCIKGMGYTLPKNISFENKKVIKYGYKCICVDDSNATNENIKNIRKIYDYGEKYNISLLRQLE